MYKGKEKGVTLIELFLLVLIVFGALMAVFIFKSPNMYINGQPICKGNLDQIGKSIKLYVIDFGRSVY